MAWDVSCLTSWPLEHLKAPLRVFMQAEGIQSETQWFSKKVSAFILSQPWGWITQVPTNTTTLPPLGQSGATQEGKKRLWLVKATGGDQSAAAFRPAAVCSLMHSSAFTLSATSAISGMGGVLASDASTHTHTHRLGTVKLCRKWCWVELIKGWERRGGWVLVQSGAQCYLREDAGVWGL